MCVCWRVREGLEGGIWVTGVGRQYTGSVPRHPPFFLPSMPCRGTRGFQGDCLGLVMDLQVGGTLYVIFSPSVGPYTIPSPPPPSFHSRLHNHCTAHKGLSSQVQARLARIKERFQLKMFFPSLFFFPSTGSFPLASCFPFSSHNSLFQSYLLLTFHSCFLHTGIFPSHFILFYVKAENNKSV